MEPIKRLPRVSDICDDLTKSFGHSTQLRNLAHNMHLLELRRQQRVGISGGTLLISDFETLSTVSDMTEMLLYVALENIGEILLPAARSGKVEYPYLIKRAKVRGLLTSKTAGKLVKIREARNFNHPEKQNNLISKYMKQLGLNPITTWDLVLSEVTENTYKISVSHPVEDSINIDGIAVHLTEPGPAPFNGVSIRAGRDE